MSTFKPERLKSISNRLVAAAADGAAAVVVISLKEVIETDDAFRPNDVATALV